MPCGGSALIDFDRESTELLMVGLAATWSKA